MRTLSQRKHVRRFSSIVAASALLVSTTLVDSALSAPLSPATAAGQQSQDNLVQVRAVVRHGGVVVGPRGGVAVHRGRTVVRGPVGRPGARWVRPGAYHWPRGGAIAAGAAIGFVAAATAAAWAGAAPAPGMCWYYTDLTRTRGFWDYCQ